MISNRPLLLIDDDEDAHFFLKRTLAKLGITVPIDSVLSGDETVAYLDACLADPKPLPAMVFLDVKMPGRNGFEVLSWMHERELTRRMPVAMMTSSDDPRDLARAMNTGANCYLTKPPAPEVLREVVHAALRTADAAAPLAPPSVTPPQPVVLVADDSALARTTTRALLESIGYTVTDVDSGEKALDFCRSTPPILVFLDLVMGGMSGMEVIARLRAMRSNLRIIVVSADADESARSAALRAGALGYIVKPLTLEQLKVEIPAVLKLPQWG